MSACLAVTGASGFVGRSVIAVLAPAGFAIRAIARTSATPGIMAGVTSCPVAGYGSRTELARALTGADYILHLADRADRKAYSAATAGEAAARAAILLAAMRDAGVRRVIVASSVYADRSGRSLYGTSKRAMEEVFLAAPPDIEAVLLRLPPLYGPGGRGAFASLSRAIAAGLPLPFALARAPRAFLDVRTLAGLVAHMLAVDDTAWRGGSGQIHCPRDRNSWSLRDLAEAIGHAIGRPPRLFPVPFIDRLLGAADLPYATSLERTFGWAPPAADLRDLAYLAGPASR